MMKFKLFLATLFIVAMGTHAFGQNMSEEAALQDFRSWAVTQGFDQADLQGLRITDNYLTEHNQVRHIYVQQAYKGLPIVNSNASFHVWNGEIVAKHQKLISGLAKKSSPTKATIEISDAFKRLCKEHKWSIPSEINFLSQAKGIEQAGEMEVPGIAHEPIKFKLVYYASEKGQLHLGWNMQVQSTDGPHYYNSIVDAQTGKLLFEEDWVVECNFEAHHTHEHDSEVHMNLFEESFMYAPHVETIEEAHMMTAQYRVLAIPTESPNHGPYVLIQDPSDAVASPFGWHDTDGVAGAEFTITRGNNVWASEDRDANNIPGFSPDGGADLDFDFVYDNSVGPDQNVEAVVTNLFYMNNIMHDVWYKYGFDEISGNFQINNYNRGGQDGDAVRADAQDGSGTNNATFGTPPDGGTPVMTMFIWPSGDPGIGGIEVNSPASIAGSITSRIGGFGDTDITTPVTADIVLVEDATNNEGCNALTNAVDVAGKIALIDRGTCEFGTKALNAQNAGAIGFIVANDGRGGPLAIMGAGVDGNRVTIPGFFISQADGNILKAELQNGSVNITVRKPFLAATDKDSDLDNGIIAHEYGHGISIRLTGGPATAGCLRNEEQAGEGWSDWFGLVMQVKPGDTGAEAKGIGTYASGEPIDGGGIRNFPYSTDMDVSPYTYDDIKSFTVPHGVGSVMCAMLWDLYWAMVDEHGFDADIYNGSGGNNMAMQLVMDGLKLQPCSPGFTDVRDAILLADRINYGGANQVLIWKVFARRGLGASASQGSTSSRSDGREAFDLPDIAKEILFMSKTVDKNFVENGDTLTFTFYVINNTPGRLSNLVVKDTLDSNLAYVNGSSTVNFNIDANVYEFQLGDFDQGADTTFTFQVIADSQDPFTPAIFEDDMEGDLSGYTTRNRRGTAEWASTTNNSFSPNTSWFVPNIQQRNDQALRAPIFTPTDNSYLSFWHNYDTEQGFDGGYIELISGGRFIDLGDNIKQNGYNSSLGSDTPMGVRPAFGGNSDGWIQTIVDLSDYAGNPSILVFHFGSDTLEFRTGWYIDDIKVQERIPTTNRATVSADEGDTYLAELEDIIAIEITDIANSARDLPNEVDIKVYPNPAKDMVNLEYVGLSADVLEIEFRNALGQIVKSLEMKPFASQKARQIDISNLPTGIYNIAIKQGERRTVKKLLVD